MMFSRCLISTPNDLPGTWDNFMQAQANCSMPNKPPQVLQARPLPSPGFAANWWFLWLAVICSPLMLVTAQIPPPNGPDTSSHGRTAEPAPGPPFQRISTNPPPLAPSQF